jgi:N-acetyl-gamma-glutamyl-phosphate reductase
VVVDAKSGVTGAGRTVKAEFMFVEANDSVRAYGLGGHRHISELVQELRDAGSTPAANPGASEVGFLPHLVPMMRGILAASHVRPTRQVTPGELRDLYAAAYAGEYFVAVVEEPPSTAHVKGSNFARVHARLDERTGRIVVVSVIDNLVKGAAGQAVQAFNIVFGLPEWSGLEQLPIVP